MRQVIAAEYLSLDGIMSDPAWSAPYFNDELAEVQSELLFASDALLLGRTTYQGMAQAWPSMGGDAFGERMNSLPKHVASRTLQTTEWNAQVIEGEVTQAVSRLKAQPGGHLLIYGSGELVRTLAEHDLIDEYRLLVHPVLVGTGKRLFTEGMRASFRLVNSVITSTGVAVLSYRPERPQGAW